MMEKESWHSSQPQSLWVAHSDLQQPPSCTVEAGWIANDWKADATNFVVLPPPWLLWAWSLSPSSSPESGKKKQILEDAYLIRICHTSHLYKAYLHSKWSKQIQTCHVSSLHFFPGVETVQNTLVWCGVTGVKKNTSPRWEAKKTHRTSTCERCCFFSSTWSDEKGSVAK